MEMPSKILRSSDITLLTGSRNANLACAFFKNLTRFNKQHIPPAFPRDIKKTKVCIIDTGLDLTDSTVRSSKRRVVDGHSWVDDDSKTYHDRCGHGTHIARLILNTTVNAEIMIAKVSDDKTFRPESMQHIASVCDNHARRSRS